MEVKGADVNVTIDGRLPLHYASDYGQLDIVKYLCSKVILTRMIVEGTRGPFYTIGRFSFRALIL